MSEIDGDKFLAFQLEPVALKLLDADEVFRDFSWEAAFPERLDEVGADLRGDLARHARDRDGLRVREPLEDHAESEPMVAVPVSHVDRGQVFAGGHDPIGELGGLAGGHDGIGEYGVALTGDEGR